MSGSKNPVSPIIHGHIDYIGSINGLVIISSAILAIIQYVDRDNSRILGEAKDKIKQFDLPALEEIKGYASQDTCKKLKKKKDLLEAELLPSPLWLMRGLLFLLPVYTFMHVGISLCPVCSSWLPSGVTITSCILFFLSILMLFWIGSSLKKKNIFLRETNTFLQMADAFLAGWNATKAKQNAQPAGSLPKTK